MLLIVTEIVSEVTSHQIVQYMSDIVNVYSFDMFTVSFILYETNVNIMWM